ncbi:MAG: methionine ABC transporter ATP-binding protein [Candidatus Liberibacter europaeus]|uniref:Methionine ABC transporter ATP-binding protein n=1 Tax=Candidatus Liberibacter europaeus TaxID=744859 RepID=A0A2T4VXW7_9HYPH|nr:methionine ABC transporter ATP-binding protein [Candidatus Liberibacter europaeus]PTL86619.1 MAG: methionine ABC transporter ATP-binding protein [Candidatus Liberibacter europaeus]
MDNSIVHKLVEEKVFDPIIKFIGVNKKVTSKNNEIEIISDVNCAIPRGKITGIIGHSGAGKSTLLRMINKLEVPTYGKIEVNGVSIESLNTADLRLMRRKIGMIFQNFNLLSSRTVYGNISFPLEIAGVDQHETESRIIPLLELMDMSDKKDYYPSQLSGGQKQRVCFARSLATRPDILLADEATSSLDPETTISCLDFLKKINDKFSISIVLITHEMAVIKHIASHVMIMNKGRIVESGKIIDIFQNPRHNITKSLLSTFSNYKIPEQLKQRIYTAPKSNSYTVTRISFLGEKATKPLISELVQKIGVDVNIIGGSIDEVAGESLGILIISYPYSAHDNVNIFFNKHQLSTEVLGYVD